MSMLEQNEIYLMILALPFVSSMLYDFMQDGMILERYGKWLETLKPIVIGKYSVEISKALGNCLKCFHIWVCIIFTLIFLNKDIADINIFRWIVSVGISYFILIKQNYE